MERTVQKTAWLYSAVTTKPITASPYLVGFILGCVTTENTVALCQRKRLPPLAHTGSAKQKNSWGRRAGVKGENISMKEERALKPCRTWEKAEKNARKEQIIKLRSLQSLILRYLFLIFVSPKIWMLNKLLYASSYYLNINCIDLNALINESWGCRQAGIWFSWRSPQDRNHLSKPKAKDLRRV